MSRERKGEDGDLCEQYEPTAFDFQTCLTMETRSRPAKATGSAGGNSEF